MTPDSDTHVVTLQTVEAERRSTSLEVALPDYERERFEDVAFMTAMGLVLLGNYSQTGHFGGPLAYTPYNVAVHLGGPAMGGMRYDLREPKHPFADRFMLTGGHSIPTCYSLWMVLYEAMRRQYETTGDERFRCDPQVGMYGIDALGFRRGPDAVERLLPDNGLVDDPLFAQAKVRGIRPLMGHAESTDVTNDVNGGPSGVGLSTTAGKALFWNYLGADPKLKVIAFEGEFALTSGHSQELKTAALAQQVGKRLRILMSMNNAGIDDSLIGGVIKDKYTGYDIANQWASYGWNVFTIGDGADFDDIFGALKTMEDWPADDRRPMLLVGPTIKGWWPTAKNGELPGYGEQLQSYASHPYALKTNSDYFIALASSFEERFGVEFEAIRDGAPGTEVERLRQFKTNIDVWLSALDKNGLGRWVAGRLVDIAGTLEREMPLRIETGSDPFLDERLLPANLPTDAVDVVMKNPVSGEEVSRTIQLFQPYGEKAGARRAISEMGAYLNYVTDNRFLTLAADLSGSINVEKCHYFGHYDPADNPAGTRLKAGIQEAVNAATVCGAVANNASADPDTFAGVWGLSGTYGSFTPLMYTPTRVFSQQKQDSPFKIGVVTILCGHSGPETAADARTHFGIFAPQTWRLMPRGQVINLYFWDYNDVAAGYFAAVAKAARERLAGVIAVHVARPDFLVADRTRFADTDLKAAAKGIYLIRDWRPDQPKQGTVFVQGSSSTMNLVSQLDTLDAEGLNVRVASVISTELFNDQPAQYRERILPDSCRYDAMFVSTMTKRMPPLPNMGPLTEEYSLYADWDDRWRTGGTEPDVIAEARLDSDSILDGIRRFASDRDERLARQRAALG
ncbi:MAG: hypothetical protein GY769_10230 [bacterium]|nr:hypothetical protein [bacterium]